MSVLVCPDTTVWVHSCDLRVLRDANAKFLRSRRSRWASHPERGESKDARNFGRGDDERLPAHSVACPSLTSLPGRRD